MPTTRGQRQQIIALTDQLRIEKARCSELELENMRLRGQNEIYRGNDIWQKEQIGRLSAVHDNERLDEGEDVAKSIKGFAEIVASNSNTIVDFVTAYKKDIESNEAVDRAWSVKLQQLINTLGSGTDLKSAKPPTKTVIVKTVGNIVADWGIGYTANLGSARTSVWLDPKDVKNPPPAVDPTCSVARNESTLSTVAGSVASAAMSNLPTPSSMATSAAAATLSRMPTTTTAVVTTVALAIATMLLSGVANLGGQPDTDEDGQAGDGGAARATDDPHRDEEVAADGK
ncbi:hypothetical protein Q9L58_005877 [Maublancomyces gigas]|uniref:Uncharacterized protein n=1 Tax=Discina gigas TaxID=1032678 RepID=A0ABR3GGR8_9PEZI